MYGGVQDGLGGWHGQDSLWADFVEERKGFGQDSLGCVKMELLCEESKPCKKAYLQVYKGGEPLK